MKPIKLSKRERQFLDLMVEDRHVKDMARILDLSPPTLSGIAFRLRRKMQAKTNYGAVAKAAALGLVEVQP